MWTERTTSRGIQKKTGLGPQGSHITVLKHKLLTKITAKNNSCNLKCCFPHSQLCAINVKAWESSVQVCLCKVHLTINMISQKRFQICGRHNEHLQILHALSWICVKSNLLCLWYSMWNEALYFTDVSSHNNTTWFLTNTFLKSLNYFTHTLSTICFLKKFKMLHMYCLRLSTQQTNLAAYWEIYINLLLLLKWGILGTSPQEQGALLRNTVL